MKLSKTELRILKQIAEGKNNVKEIAKAIKKSEKQVYVSIKKLKNKQILNKLEPNKTIYINLLLKLLVKNPTIYEVLSDSGIPILNVLPNTIKQIEKKTKLKRAIIYRKLELAKKRSIITKKENKFQITQLWKDLKEFLDELKKYEQTIDKNIPLSAIIYYKNNNNILFSCKENVNATKTAFSAFEKYGIKLFLNTNFFFLPNKKLTKKEILKHALIITKNEKTIQNLIFIAIFYAKYRKEFKIRDKILININKILNKEKIKGYPSYEEIKNRAEIYGVKI